MINNNYFICPMTFLQPMRTLALRWPTVIPTLTPEPTHRSSGELSFPSKPTSSVQRVSSVCLSICPRLSVLSATLSSRLFFHLFLHLFVSHLSVQLLYHRCTFPLICSLMYGMYICLFICLFSRVSVRMSLQLYLVSYSYNSSICLFTDVSIHLPTYNPNTRLGGSWSDLSTP